MDEDTIGQTGPVDREVERMPGLVLVFGGGVAQLQPLEAGPPIEVGRTWIESLGIQDTAISRHHARVTLVGRGWRVEDLGSRNGTYVDGVRVSGQVEGALRVLRAGGTVFLLEDDVLPHARRGLRAEDGLVIGPSTGAVLDEVSRLAKVSEIIHVTGQSGAGKELVARAFHRSGPRPKGPFVAVNCATIPKELAERLLFGTRKGAYSGADADAEGYLQAAHRGTLFLDEVGELEPTVQAKLLRVLETREVVPLGATRGQPVDVRVCSATLRNLRELVVSGRFREDLYFRLARPEVEVRPLRERGEEIPWLVQQVLGGVDEGMRPRATLIEACLLRAWPGNVRELLTEVRTAAVAAQADGSATVDAIHLSPTAGLALQEESAPEPAEVSEMHSRRPSRERIAAMLRKHEGNVAATARALGIHRTQLRRWMAADGLESKPRR